MGSLLEPPAQVLRKLTIRDDALLRRVLADEECGRPAESALDPKTHALACISALIAMDAAGVGDAESARATTFVANNIGSYVGTGTESYAGATAKVLLVSLSQGRTPKGFLGGFNLLARLKARQTTGS